ncbi:MAG: hypothetical protein ACK55I_36960, partial [bacterium]
MVPLEDVGRLRPGGQGPVDGRPPFPGAQVRPEVDSAGSPGLGAEARDLEHQGALPLGEGFQLRPLRDLEARVGRVGWQRFRVEQPAARH